MGKPAKLSNDQIARRRSELSNGWNVAGERQLEREWAFRNFKDALEFTNEIGAIAEDMDHHPDIFLAWGKVKASISTHTVGGLTELDFELAQRIDAAVSPRS